MNEMGVTGVGLGACTLRRKWVGVVGKRVFRLVGEKFVWLLLGTVWLSLS